MMKLDLNILVQSCHKELLSLLVIMIRIPENFKNSEYFSDIFVICIPLLVLCAIQYDNLYMYLPLLLSCHLTRFI